MKRYHALLGTKTTAGGEIISASSARSINGVKVALEGDKIYCPSCKTEGVIRCHGPRLIETWNGISFALEHDLCICGCTPPPTLLTAQASSSQTTDGHGLVFEAGGANFAAANRSAWAESSVKKHAFDIHFLIKDEGGKPVANVPYRITLATGDRIIGMTDVSGLTRTIGSASASVATLEAPFYGNSSSDALSRDEHPTCGC